MKKGWADRRNDKETDKRVAEDRGLGSLPSVGLSLGDFFYKLNSPTII